MFHMLRWLWRRRRAADAARMLQAAVTLLQRGERAAAAASLEESIRLQPRLAEAHYLLGHVLCDDDRVEEGLAHFRRALELRPEYAEARWSLALGGIPQVYGDGDDPAQVRRELAA